MSMSKKNEQDEGINLIIEKDGGNHNLRLNSKNTIRKVIKSHIANSKKKRQNAPKTAQSSKRFSNKQSNIKIRKIKSIKL